MKMKLLASTALARPTPRFYRAFGDLTGGAHVQTFRDFQCVLSAQMCLLKSGEITTPSFSSSKANPQA